MTYYYLIIALQIACVYHIYKTRNETYWYFVVLLIPAIGCIIYVVTQMIDRKDVAVVQKELTQAINPTAKVTALERKLNFADTYENQINLGDAYAEMGAFAKAISQYTTALQGTHRDDFYGNSQLLLALYNSEQYDETIAIAEKLAAKAEFEGSHSQFTYGLALSKLGKRDQAISILGKIDRRYDNYAQRLKLVKFFIEIEKREDAIALLERLLSEHENMTKANRKTHRATFRDINELHATLTA